MKSIVCRIGFALICMSLCAQIAFQDPDINAGNEVLFTISANIPGGQQYATLFLRNVESGAMEQLTFYPESIQSLSSGKILQLRNRFGTARFDASSETFSWIDEGRPFVHGGPILKGLLPDVAASPDGKWLVLVEPVTSARGRLVLYNADKSVRYVLADSIERGSIPVSWAPDSSVMVYALGGTLYFARPENFFSVSTVGQQFRIVGPGEISCISWFGPNRFLYARGRNVYRIQTPELFARSLYSSLIGVGELAGKLAVDFDPLSDRFSASPEGDAVIHARGNRTVQYFPLAGDDFARVSNQSQLPWLLLPGNTAWIMPVWTQAGVPLVFASSVYDGSSVIRGWRLADVTGSRIFSPLPMPEGAVSLEVSRTGSHIAFISKDALRIYSSSQWAEIALFREEPVVSIAWADEGRLFIGGTQTVRRWNFLTNTSDFFLLSSISRSGWDEKLSSIVCETVSLEKRTYAGNMKWLLTPSARMRPAQAVNTRWRLYLDSGKGFYANMLYVRSAGSPAGTRAIVTEPVVKATPAPVSSKTAQSPSSVFSHGSRTGLRQVALAFDAMDSIDGLASVLHVLSRYKLRSTFFINGEFIRRNPAAVNEIVKSGHQCASLFYTTWDLSGTQYRIDEDFIVRGLARNEDDFYNATGQELSLLWHAPFYVSSPLILSAGQSAGYRYVSPDISVGDWVTHELDVKVPGLYQDTSVIIENIIRKVSNGSIIPVRLGKGEGSRDDYLFNRIDLLISALLEEGFEIVPVDTLILNERK